MKGVHEDCVNKYMEISGKSIQWACPMNCNPKTLKARELELLEGNEEEASENASTASGSGSRTIGVEIIDDEPSDLLS